MVVVVPHAAHLIGQTTDDDINETQGPKPASLNQTTKHRSPVGGDISLIYLIKKINIYIIHSAELHDASSCIPLTHGNIVYDTLATKKINI